MAVTVTGVIDGDYTYLAVDDIEGEIFQVANMDTRVLQELMSMYNRSCSHIDFQRLLGPHCTISLLLVEKIIIVCY